MKSYPEKINTQIKKLIKNSKPIESQYIVSQLEEKSLGVEKPFSEGRGAFSLKWLERIYKDRLVIILTYNCLANCRFCFRKNLKEETGEISFEEIEEAIRIISNLKEIRSVLITGGDPLMNIDKLFFLLRKLVTLSNIFEIRIGTRFFLTNPQIFNKEMAKAFLSLEDLHLSNPLKSKTLAFNVHFNHIDELTDETLKAISLFTSRGILFRNQTVLLKGINDNAKILRELHLALTRNKIQPYYLSHCDPVIGASHFRTSLKRGLAIYRELLQESSTLLPHYILDLPVGKVHLHPDMPLEYLWIEGERYVKIQTPYFAQEFKKITHKDLPPFHEEDKEGRIVGLYLDGQE